MDTGILTGLTDVFSLVYEQGSFPVLKIIRIQDNKNEFKKGSNRLFVNLLCVPWHLKLSQLDGL